MEKGQMSISGTPTTINRKSGRHAHLLYNCHRCQVCEASLSSYITRCKADVVDTSIAGIAARRLLPGVKLLAAGCRYQRSTCIMLGLSDLWPYTNCVAKHEYVGSFAQSLRHSPANQPCGSSPSVCAFETATTFIQWQFLTSGSQQIVGNSA